MVVCDEDFVVSAAAVDTRQENSWNIEVWTHIEVVLADEPVVDFALLQPDARVEGRRDNRVDLVWVENVGQWRHHRNDARLPERDVWL